eukprot:CAMPEP_0115016268 /NCGR_PEP_ID=MMETSP0216-20121206/27324_1 /TAXON_ID=223996 /ORGANISM="Protocruzia adherens, Strain Boccale" /LENGTH=978 /DNA_ID=CAMNT_0002386669 /DNA_START=407 /DNA_END=3343 /DNA_ORIENTATION=-
MTGNNPSDPNTGDQNPHALPTDDFHRSETVDHIIKESEPSKVSELFVRWPLAIIAVVLTVGILCTVAAFSTLGLDDDGSRSFLVWSDYRVQRYDAYVLALDEYDEKNKTGQEDLQSEEVSSWLIWLVYEEKKGNLLNKNSIDNIRAFEEGITKLPRFNEVCYREIDSTSTAADGRSCHPYSNSVTSSFTPGASEAQLQTEVTTLIENDAAYRKVRSRFDKDFNVNNKTADWLRSSMKFGAPIVDEKGKRYNYYLDDEKPQDEFMEEFALDVADYVDDFSSSNFDVYYWNRLWYQKKQSELILQDFAFIGLSIAFVLFYMMFHTRSAIIPIIGMLQVALAFPIAYCIYRYIFQVTFFNMMSLLSVFVILGIAADDMFVYVDTWKQSAEHEILLANLERRTIWTYRKAAHAMFVTTFTTFCAFMATGVSSIMPIAAFGMFSGCYVVCNYLLVITNFPAVVVLREKFNIWRASRKQAKSQSSRPRSPKNSVIPSPHDSDGEKDKEKSRQKEEIEDGSAPINESTTGLKRSHTALRAKEMSKADRFFYTTYSHKLRQGRFIVFGFFLVWLILSIVFTAQLTPPEEDEEFIPEDHELRRTLVAMEDNFPKGENDGAQITFVVWGLDGVDRSDVNRWDAEDRGDLEWDDSFDMSPPESQQKMADFCDQLKTIQDKDLVQSPDDVTCFLDTFRSYLTSKGHTFPVPQADFLTRLQEYINNPTESGSDKEVSNRRIGLIQGRLRYVVFKAIGGDREPASGMEPRHDAWEDIVDTWAATAPAGINKPYQTSRYWLWMVTERALVKNAVEGIAIAGTISFFVLVISTLNIVLSIYAILCIIGIILSVMSVMFFNGWDFGTAESIAVVILIGFSVDYVVHLCHAYMESHRGDRVNRTRDALAKMGFSIIGGAVTTFGDGCMLFFCTFLFFLKFAWIVTSTIFFALIWALLFLPAVMFIAGPQDDTGNLKVYARRVHQWYKTRQEQKSLK